MAMTHAACASRYSRCNGELVQKFLVFDSILKTFERKQDREHNRIGRPKAYWLFLAGLSLRTPSLFSMWPSTVLAQSRDYTVWAFEHVSKLEISSIYKHSSLQLWKTTVYELEL